MRTSGTSPHTAVFPATENGEPIERSRVVVRVAQRVFGASSANFFVLLGVTLFLVAFGLVMVLSSSSVENGAAKGHNFFGSFSRQVLYALIGVPLMLVASRIRPVFWRRVAWPAVVVSAILQLLVFIPGLGYSYQGNQNWIHIGAFTAQPSELVKLALILWISWVLATKRNLLRDWKHVALPIAPVAATAIGLVLLGKDLGTTIILVMIVFGCLFYAGVRLRIICTGLLIVAVLTVAVAASRGSRTARVGAWFTGCGTNQNYLGACWQTVHAWWGIASGGVFGSGLGESKIKWNWLPEADSDFIFAIIGDELGLIGAVLIIVLFAVLAMTLVRIARSLTDPFQRIVTGGVLVWIVGEAFVNIGVVLGFLPVFGVPLPLISAGGSSLIVSLAGIGIVLSFARHPAVSAPEEGSLQLGAVPRRRQGLTLRV